MEAIIEELKQVGIETGKKAQVPADALEAIGDNNPEPIRAGTYDVIVTWVKDYKKCFVGFVKGSREYTCKWRDVRDAVKTGKILVC